MSGELKKRLPETFLLLALNLCLIKNDNNPFSESTFLLFETTDSSNRGIFEIRLHSKSNVLLLICHIFRFASQHVFNRIKHATEYIFR